MTLRAAEPTGTEATPALTGSKALHGIVAKTKNGQSSKTFLNGTQKIYGIWKGETLKAGDIVRAVWMAESFGYSRKDVKISEGAVTAYKPDDEGVFSLARPQGGWPLGRYRLDFYVQNKLADTAKFLVEEDVSVEVR